MKRVISVMLLILLFSVTFQSCKKPIDDLVYEEGEGKVSFSFSLSQEKSALKSATDSGYVQGITSVVYTIEDLQGNVIKNSEKIEIYNMNGFYISKPISLAIGGYKLTQFLVLNANNSIIYAAPIIGSAKAYLVENKLPMLFNTQKDIVTQIVPEVLSTAESTPEDFGYVTFNFEISKTFDFLVGAFIYNDLKKNYELTDASISIYSDTTVVYTSQLTNPGSASLNYDTLGITNKITLPERYNKYTVKISKPGYTTYDKTFTKEELRLQYRSEDKGPLVVVLEKQSYDLTQGLVAYYPFNGNVDDESGNGNNGINNGATLTSDRHSNVNSAYYFDNNMNHYISVPATNLVNINEYTYSVWINSLAFPPTTINGYYIFVVGSATAHAQAITIHPNGGILGTSYNVGSNPQGSWYKTLPIQVGQWTHIVYTRDFSKLEVFINGNLVQNTDNATYYPYTHNQPANYGSTEYFANIGCRPNLNYNNGFLGAIDDLRIYNRVLTKEEILYIYLNNY